MARVTCPKCSSAMERGHLPDVTHGAVSQGRWTRGDPEEVRFLGMSIGIKDKPKESVPVTAYRCSRCGYVELYALKD